MAERAGHRRRRVNELGPAGYYADFIVYPAASVALLSTALQGATPAAAIPVGLAAVAGLASWSLVEYGIHRLIFHGLQPFAAMHAMHHARPRALIGAPAVAGLTVLAVGLFLPVWAASSAALACGATAGMMLGYLWYVTVHHLLHHRPRGLLARAAPALLARHAAHHAALHPGNFGVTTVLWDAVFRTRLPAGTRTRPG